MEARTYIEAKKVKGVEATLAAQKECNDLMKTRQEMMLFMSFTDTSDPVAV